MSHLQNSPERGLNCPKRMISTCPHNYTPAFLHTWTLRSNCIGRSCAASNNSPLAVTSCTFTAGRKPGPNSSSLNAIIKLGTCPCDDWVGDLSAASVSIARGHLHKLTAWVMRLLGETLSISLTGRTSSQPASAAFKVNVCAWHHSLPRPSWGHNRGEMRGRLAHQNMRWNQGSLMA